MATLSRCQHHLLRPFSVFLTAVSLVLASTSANAWWWSWEDVTPAPKTTQQVVFVGNNWEGMIDVIDADTYEHLGRINGIPDKHWRMTEIVFNPIHFPVFLGIRHLVGEGHDQYVDDMYSSNDGRLLIVSRPSFADVVAIDIATNDIIWRFKVKGFRSDHMAISPDGTQVAVSASTGDVVHVLDIETGRELAQFKTGDSPHENVYSKDGKRLYHASIGNVFLAIDHKRNPSIKGKRRFQIMDTNTWEVIDQFDMQDKLKDAGFDDLSAAVRPMAHTDDERFFYFQLSFLHGFVEYDMEEKRVTRLAKLPNHIPDVPLTKYVNDSAHHGIAMSGDDSTLCVAGTMDDYIALVDRHTFEYTLLEGLGKKPYWVTQDKSGDHCFISWSESNTMSVISFKDAKEIARINVGYHPQRIREGFIPSSWKSRY